MNKYKMLFLNTGLFAIGQLGTKIITFFLVPLYTYYMSTEEFGITDMSWTVINLITPLATLATATSVLRFIIDDKAHIKEYVTAGTAVTLVGCVVVALTSPVYNLPMFGGLGNYKILFIIVFSVQAIQTQLSTVSRALNKLRLIPISSIVTSLVTAFSAVVCIAWLKMTVDGYFISLTIGTIAGCLIYTFGMHYMHYLSWPLLFRNRALLKDFLLFSLPLVPNTLFWWIGNSVNRFFITSMLGIGASGLFAAASKIPNLLNICWNVFQQAWQLSAFQEYKKKDIAGFFTMICKLLNAMLVIAGAGIAVLAPWLSSFLLQKEFYSAWPLIPPLIIAFYLNVMLSFFGSIYTTVMKTRQVMSTTIVGAVSVVILTWVFIKIFGLVGAAVAMCFSDLIVLILRIIGTKDMIRVRLNWVLFGISLAILSIQAVVMWIQVPGYMYWSIAIFILSTILQICYISPEIKLFVSRMRKNIERHQ